MKKTIIHLSLLTLLVSSCGGRAANPVMPVQYGDERKSCKSLERELIFTQSEIQRLNPKTEKTGKNVALGVAGAFLLVPWFFMDFGSAEEQEVNALRQRYMNLSSIAEDKRCDVSVELITEERAKEMQKAQDQQATPTKFKSKVRP